MSSREGVAAFGLRSTISERPAISLLPKSSCFARRRVHRRLDSPKSLGLDRHKLSMDPRSLFVPRDCRIAAIAIILIAASLIFFRLDRRLLWVDEAETALLARNVLVYGVPKAYDGKNLISQEVGREYGPNYVWRWTPWLDKYVAAMSFALLGESTLSARLPFAIVGLFSVISMYPLAMVLFRDRWVGIFSMAFLTLTVPFVLHVRQCRYYSLAVVASIWAIYFLVGLAQERRGAVAGFAAAMTILFHSNNLAFLATGIALAPFLFALDFSRTALWRLVWAGAIVVVVNGPWAYFFVLGKREEALQSFSENLAFYLEVTNRYTLPFAAVLVFLGLRWYLGRKRLRITAEAWRCFLGLIVFVVYILSCCLLHHGVSIVTQWAFCR